MGKGQDMTTPTEGRPIAERLREVLPITVYNNLLAQDLIREAAALLDQAKEALIDASDFICASIYADSASAEPTLIKINAALAALNGTPAASPTEE